MAVLAVIGLGSCRSNYSKREIIDIHNSKICFAWDGVYTGITPAANGPGIDIRLKINKDQSFEVRYEYLNKPNILFNRKGTFKWDDQGCVITLNIKDLPPHYYVIDKRLIQLDMKGNLITGKSADNYVLYKEQ